jgi:hypothetical protein
MNFTKAIGILHFWILLIAFWFWFHVLWRRYRLDAFRDNLFALRDELFRYAMQEESLPFHHPAYIELREDLNSVIRFAEKMTVLRAMLLIPFMPKHLRHDGWAANLHHLPLHVQKILVGFRRIEIVEIANYVLFTSPLLMLFYYLLNSIGSVSMLVTRFLNRMRDFIARPLEEQARDHYRLAS